MERFSCGNTNCRTCHDSPAIRLGDTIRHATSRYALHRKQIWNHLAGNLSARAEVMNIDTIIREIEAAVEKFMTGMAKGEPER
jgi:hypothetical protein